MKDLILGIIGVILAAIGVAHDYAWFIAIGVSLYIYALYKLNTQ